tara:strand:- start:108 stop:677 length:570 start_codon:yes stop_codon:yes gene_type:complete
MATALEIIRGIAQAAAGGYDGALDENGEPIKIGLKREEGHVVNDSRTMDGFKVRLQGPCMILTYQSEIKLKEVHDSNFENDVNQTLADISSFIKKEYKKITGESLSLKERGEADIMVQNVSRVRSWVQAKKIYDVASLMSAEVSILEADLDESGSEEKLDKAIKSFLAIGKDKYPKTKKPRNVTRKGEQ